ncbi:hypothetical protein KIPE111705_30050 [Kibdelosporangium persicum]|uniref:DUF4386 domain-containing protein n=1 Tax=Kibdelosporangium persicum TaxID=2698649 RepID=A0ABX2EVS7_9PSEU|nr:hypothetical protein [Kibdelosporangium persicum]NRN63063.1 hypothetical protein [Kibdelosporangium persicum]
MYRKVNSFSQVSGVAGLGFAILIVLGNAILVPAGMPVPGTEFGQVSEFLLAHGGTVGLVSALAPVTWMSATVFGAGAVVALWSSTPGWSLVGFAGLLLQNGTFTAVIALRLAATSAPDEGLWALHDALLTINGTFLAVAMLGLSTAGLRSGLIRRWHAILGFVSATFTLTSATLTPWVIDTAGPLGLIGLTGWLMWVVWIGTYGVTLIRLTPQHIGS